MRTVRTRLLAIVLLCIAPAIVSALFRAFDAERDLLEQIEDRVRSADAAFESELDEDRSNARLGARLAAENPRVARALDFHRPGEAKQAADVIGHLYTETLVALVDSRGGVMAGSNPARLPKTLALPELVALQRGEEAAALVSLDLGTAHTWALVVAAPVTREDRVVGAVALLTPIDAEYLEHIEKKIGSNLAIKVDDVLIAACGDHPSPNLEAHGGGVIRVAKDGRQYALATFSSTVLQSLGRNVEVTASEDTTALRTEAHVDLAKSLGVLIAALLVALAVTWKIAGAIVDAVRRISAAAARVRAGDYAPVEGVHTGDELEALAGDFNLMVRGLDERDRLKTMFGKYVTRQVVEHLMLNDPQLGEGRALPVTVLFSDIRGFTTLSEKMDPKELLDFLNAYFTGMVDSVLKNDGVVDKFIGDALMAVFGAPHPTPNDALNAVRAAIEMKATLRRMNDGFRAKGLPEIRTGIGIHTGNVVAGPMGHHERMEYAVIGDAVNLASRLESMTKELGVDVLLSEDTYNAIKHAIDAEPLRKIRVKGREQEVMVYRLVGLTGEIPRVAGV